MSVLDYVIVALVVAGAFFGLVAAVGIVRLPDLYTRAHATSKSDTLGAVLTLAGIAFVFGADLPAVKTLLLLVFMFLTNPTAAHAITRAAYDQGIEPWTNEAGGADPLSADGDDAGSTLTGDGGTRSSAGGPDAGADSTGGSERGPESPAEGGGD